MVGGSGSGSSGVSWILSRLAMYVDRQPQASCLSTGGWPGLSLCRDGTSLSTWIGGSRRGRPGWDGVLCRSRWHCSFEIATLDIWMVATLIRLGSFSSSLLLCQISFVPLRSIGPAHYRSSIYTIGPCVRAGACCSMLLIRPCFVT